MKFNRKLTKKGFSAVEIVIAVVAVVVVAGLGYFAYANYSGTKSNSTEDNKVASTQGSGDEVTSEEFDAIQANAAGYLRLNGSTVSVLLCSSSATKVTAVFVSKHNFKYQGYKSGNQPYLKIGNGEYYGGRSWWLGFLQKYTWNVGNVSRNNGVRAYFKYGSRNGYTNLGHVRDIPTC